MKLMSNLKNKCFEKRKSCNGEEKKVMEENTKCNDREEKV